MGKLKFNSQTPLYTSDAAPWRLDQVSDVLDRLHARSKPIVVFVHGRGKEPNKSLRGATFVKGLAVPKIELGYDASALLFNWDSAFPGVAFLDRTQALRKAPAGAKSFGEFVSALRDYRDRHPSLPPPTLLVHSMGSVVIQQCVERGFWPSGQAAFRYVVLSQPDADDVGHALWLDSLAKQEAVFVTFNRDDKVLKRSTDARPEGRHALGLGTIEPLSAYARYVDLSGMGPIGSDKDDDHEVFGKGAMNGQVHVCQFFEQALRGDPVELDPATNVELIDRNVVFRLKVKVDQHAPCLRQRSLESA